MQVHAARAIGAADDIAGEFFVPVDVIPELFVLATGDGHQIAGGGRLFRWNSEKRSGFTKG
jgi:hypothetical protein